MSDRYNGTHFENHRRAAELHDMAAHAHRSAAEQKGKQDHLSGNELSKQAMEHSRKAYEHSQSVHGVIHGKAMFGHAEIAARAHEIWQAKGCPEGTADEDWHQAAKELRERA